MQFLVIYTREAHPVGSPGEGDPLAQPVTYRERVKLASRMIAEEGITVPVLVDEMDNPVWCTYGPAPDIAYLIGTDGRIIEKQGWYQPQLMETAIVDYLAGDGN